MLLFLFILVMVDKLFRIVVVEILLMEVIVVFVFILEVFEVLWVIINCLLRMLKLSGK